MILSDDRIDWEELKEEVLGEFGDADRAIIDQYYFHWMRANDQPSARELSIEYEVNRHRVQRVLARAAKLFLDLLDS
jgi:hypothetical protein